MVSAQPHSNLVGGFGEYMLKVTVYCGFLVKEVPLPLPLTV